MPPAGQIPAIIASVLGGFCYFAWLYLFFAKVRPRARDRLGARLGVTIQDGHEAGWEVSERGHLGKGVLVAVADIALILCATLGPLATLGAIAYLVQLALP